MRAQFTTGLIEKIAGVKRPEPDAAPQGAGPSGRPFSPEVAAIAQHDKRLMRALHSSRRVGNLLLKQEAEELEKIDALAGDLLKKHRRVFLGAARLRGAMQ